MQGELSSFLLQPGFCYGQARSLSGRKCLRYRSVRDSTTLQLQNQVAIFYKRAITELIPTKNECTLAG
jgi:hypothetical protein